MTSFQPYAITFQPHLEERVWGGRRLARYGRRLPEGVSIGESWEIAGFPEGGSVVERGPYRGQPLGDLAHSHAVELVGDVAALPGVFPLLVKLLDATTCLSVQLHPGDDEARALEGGGAQKNGKTEAWLILEADPGAEIIHGLAPGVEPQAFFERMEGLRGGRLPAAEERTLFRWVPVRPGDVVFVPAGTVHALGSGVVLAEVQQASDITYRIYDWGRRDDRGRSRELHVEKARRVRRPRDVECPHVRIPDLAGGGRSPNGSRVASLLSCEQFHLDLVSLGKGAVHNDSTASRDRRAFRILFVWNGTLNYRSSRGESLEIPPSTFVLLPVALGAYEIRAAGGAAECVVVGPGPRPE